MYVCICNGVTDRQIREAAEAGCTTVSEMTMRTGAGASCGSCLGMVAELIEETRARRELDLPILARAAVGRQEVCRSGTWRHETGSNGTESRSLTNSHEKMAA